MKNVGATGMKLGALCSGGKDSWFAVHRALQSGYRIECLITVLSANPESYLFHTPNADRVALQAEASGIPLVAEFSEGHMEQEVEDLERAVIRAKQQYQVRGVVTGAIRSVYQATRIQRICSRNDLWCFNPLWLSDEPEYLGQLVSEGFSVIITGVFAEPFCESWLGRRLDEAAVSDLLKTSARFRTSPAGEGGEFETFVTDAPFFHQRIEILESAQWYVNNRGVFIISRACLQEK